MEITEVKVKVADRKDDRVKGFATLTFDNAFVVRDMRIIEGKSGLFVAMPSRPMKESCPKCGYRNPIKNKFCARCGGVLNFTLPEDEKEAHRDIAHPINQEMRRYIQDKVIEEYERELGGAAVPPIERIERIERIVEEKVEESAPAEEEVKPEEELKEEKPEEVAQAPVEEKEEEKGLFGEPEKEEKEEDKGEEEEKKEEEEEEKEEPREPEEEKEKEVEEEVEEKVEE